MEAYLGTDGTITLQSIELQLTIHCTMDFRMYPFDQQVSCKIPQSRAMINILNIFEKDFQTAFYLNSFLSDV